MELFQIFITVAIFATVTAQEQPVQEVSAAEAATAAIAAPSSAILRTLQKNQETPSPINRVQNSNDLEGFEVPILKNVQHMPDAEGVHSFDFEAGNGIKFQFSGSEGQNGGASMVGIYSYPMEDGKIAEVSFVADENGYQPDSSLLPVAPAFPHPIPQFVLDQIEFARLEDEQKAREGRLEES